MRPARIAAVVAVIGCTMGACRSDRAPEREERKATVVEPQPPPAPIDMHAGERGRMVAETITGRGIRDRAVVKAMLTVPRHRMVPPEQRDEAYADRALPIGFGLTISQPYIVALMTEAAQVEKGDRVLEIGTGSGYQAAVLAEMGAKVYTIEIHEELAARTRKVLDRLGYGAVELEVGDGYVGLPRAAQFDAILITAAVAEVPPPLLEQLAPGGRLVVPLGDEVEQELVVLLKLADGSLDRHPLLSVRFGPMIGRAADDR